MTRKQTSPNISSLASRILNEGYKPSGAEIRSMAGSLLSQDETPQVGPSEPSGAQEADWADAHKAKDEDEPW